MDIEKTRPRSVGGIRTMDSTLGQTPNQEGIDGPKRKATLIRGLFGALDMLEHPTDFSCREIGIQQEPCLRTKHGLEPFIL